MFVLIVVENVQLEIYHLTILSIQFNSIKQTLGDSEGQGSLECYSPWGRKDRTRLSN